MTMDFARRPALAGNNLKRTQFATIRGRVRRWDPDGTSIVPYFPGSVGNLYVSVNDADTVTVYITDTSLTKVLEALNTALNPGARAYDDGGCIALQSRTKGGRGSIAVIGGSAALSLGFDVSLHAVRAVGGEVESGPEGRQANAFGVALPGEAESLNTGTFSRALGRLAGNADVLYSDHARQSARIAKLGVVAAQTQLGSGHALITPPGGPSIYTGLGVLDRTSSPEELAAFFLLIDPVTQRVSQSRVVAVVSGTVAGGPPYDNISSVLEVGNVLGTNPRRLGPVTIEDIREGRIIQASQAFGAVQVGDVAEITGDDAAINADPWDNRGMRWVVEEVSADQIALRPMSRGELHLFGVVVKDEQPVVELNSTKLNTQNFGQVTIYAGSFFQGPNLVISPPMPFGVSYEVWAAVPKSFREEGGGEDVSQLRAHVREQVSWGTPLPNGILTRPTFGSSGATFDIGEFYARWHGRAIRIPAISFLPSTGQIYWDEGDALVKMGALPVGGHLLGVAAASGGSWTVRRAAVKLDQNRFVPTTVGAKGQFANLTEALDWALVANQEAELVLLENQQAPDGGWILPAKSFLIRGGVPGVQLLFGASGPLFVATGATLFLENVSFDTSKTWQTGATSWDLRDVRDSHGNRTIDSSGAVDIGPNSAVGIGSAGKTTAIRGHATVAEGLDITGDETISGHLGVGGGLSVGSDIAGEGDLNLPSNKKMQVGTPGAAAGARLDTDGTQGRLVLSKTAEGDIALYKDHIDLLVGGSGSDSQSLHTHGNLALSSHLHDGRYSLLGHGHAATEVSASSGAFNGILTSAENTVQKALDKVDDHNHDGRYLTSWVSDNNKEDKSYSRKFLNQVPVDWSSNLFDGTGVVIWRYGDAYPTKWVEITIGPVVIPYGMDTFSAHFLVQLGGYIKIQTPSGDPGFFLEWQFLYDSTLLGTAAGRFVPDDSSIPMSSAVLSNHCLTGPGLAGYDAGHAGKLVFDHIGTVGLSYYKLRIRLTGNNGGPNSSTVATMWWLSAALNVDYVANTGLWPGTFVLV